jgi:hypothetical protein
VPIGQAGPLLVNGEHAQGEFTKVISRDAGADRRRRRPGARGGLVELLSAEPSIEIVGQASIGREAVERARSRLPTSPIRRSSTSSRCASARSHDRIQIVIFAY